VTDHGVKNWANGAEFVRRERVTRKIIQTTVVNRQGAVREWSFRMAALTRSVAERRVSGGVAARVGFDHLTVSPWISIDFPRFIVICAHQPVG